jgi:multiple sugar transport system substrate-binding protein
MTERKISRRDWMKLAGLTTAGAALAACAPAVPQATPTPEITLAPTHTLEVKMPTGESIEGFTPAMTNPAEKIKLLYWWGNAYEPAMEYTHELIKRFSVVYPNVEVEPVGAQTRDSFVTAAAAGTPPDLFHTWGDQEPLGNWADRGMIAAVDDYIKASDFDESDFIGGVQDANKMNGKTYGIADSGGLFLLWTRPPVFKEIGKEPTAMPKDMAEMWQWAEDITTKDESGNITRLGMSLPSWSWQYYGWLANFGGEIWNMKENMPSPDNPGVLAGLDDIVAQVDKYGVDALARWNSSIGAQTGAQNPWLTGQLAMQFEGDWQGQVIFDFFPEWEVDKDYGIVPLPPGAGATDSPVCLWPWSWVMPTGLKNPDWAWELQRFLLSAEYQLNVHGKFKELVLRKSMIDDPRQWWPAAKKARQLLEGDRGVSTFIPMAPVMVEYTTLLIEAIDKVKALEETPEEAMKRVKEETLAKMQGA